MGRKCENLKLWTRYHVDVFPLCRMDVSLPQREVWAYPNGHLLAGIGGL